MGEAGRSERTVDRKAENLELRKAGTRYGLRMRRWRSGGACDRLGGDPVLFADEERVAPPSGMLTGDKTKTAG